jgi:hypothetical protein
MRIVARAAEVKTNVGARTLEGQVLWREEKRARTIDEVACNGATHPQTRRTQRLQKARCTIPNDRIYQRLTFENPTGHRKSQRRIANMHKPHSPTPEQHKMLGRTLGEEPLTETKLAPVTRKCNAPKVLCANAEVIDGHHW